MINESLLKDSLIENSQQKIIRISLLLPSSAKTGDKILLDTNQGKYKIIVPDQQFIRSNVITIDLHQRLLLDDKIKVKDMLIL